MLGSIKAGPLALLAVLRCARSLDPACARRGEAGGFHTEKGPPKCCTSIQSFSESFTSCGQCYRLSSAKTEILVGSCGARAQAPL